MAINSSSFQVGDSGGTSRRGTPKEGIENWQRSLSSFLIVHSMHTVDVPQSPSTCNTKLRHRLITARTTTKDTSPQLGQCCHRAVVAKMADAHRLRTQLRNRWVRSIRACSRHTGSTILCQESINSNLPEAYHHSRFFGSTSRWTTG